MSRALLSLAGCFVVATAGCSNGDHHARSANAIVVDGPPSGIPRPPFGRALKAGYRAQHVWFAHLTGQSVPEAIVTSVGPPTGSLGFHSADLQVLSWDSIAERWAVVFDGQKTQPLDQFQSPSTSNYGVTSTAFSGDLKPPPLLDPAANVTLGPVRFGRLFPGKGAQLVFSSFANYGGSGLPGNLVVVDFDRGLANLAYFWSGDGGVRYTLAGNSRLSSIRARASYWTPADAHCCPIRSYTFKVGRRSDRYLEELSDERPWLGAVVKPVDESDNTSPLAVIDVVPGSPAEGKIEKGDVVAAITNSRRPRPNSAIGPVLYDQFAKLNAGDTVRLRVTRVGLTRTVVVRLGSLSDPSVGSAFVPDDYTISVL
jgi:hypothetical protein